MFWYQTIIDVCKYFKTKIVLGQKWEFFSQVSYQSEEGCQISLELVSPEGIRILSKIQLLKYCELKKIDKIKIKSFYFHFWESHSKLESNTCYIVKNINNPMHRAVEGLKAKKWLEAIIKAKNSND